MIKYAFGSKEGDLNVIKNMIANTKKPMNRFGAFKEQVNAHNLPFYSLSSSSKVIDYLYLPAMENFHEWLKTFLDKAIRDAEDSVYNYNNVCIQECRRATSILREHEQSYKIKKDKYELFCEEIIKNIELLEAKGKADILNYLQSMYDSMNIFYHQSINYFPESDSYK
ncbi:hypothetical protein U3516DRAFT_734701 [Neocallimastix sp. 'constans']